MSPVIDPPRPPPEAERGDVDGQDRERTLRQLAGQRKHARCKRLAGYTLEGRRVGDSRRDCRIPDRIVRQVRALHEDRRWTCRKIQSKLRQELHIKVSLSWVRKVCGYERRASTAVTWKPIDDAEG